MEDEEERFTKPGFDARKQYNEVLKQYILRIAEAQLTTDLNLWLTLLDGLFSIVQPFIDPAKAKEIDAKLNNIRIEMNNWAYQRVQGEASNAVVHGYKTNLLSEATKLMYMHARHILLPVSDERMNDFDDDEFLRGSDL